MSDLLQHTIYIDRDDQVQPQQSPIIMFKWGSKKKPFRCQLCDMSFENGEELRLHVPKHESETSKKPHQCHVCPKSFKTIKSLERHALIHYGQGLKRCKFCYKVFANRENLARHILIHDGKKPFKCDICEETFVFKQGMEAHRMTHTGLKPFVCHICNKGFNRKDILERHMLVHSGEKKFKCVECGKMFSHIYVLKRHTRTVHSQEFDGMACGICGKFIKAKENMRRHMRLHTGERPFKCPTCDKAFTQKQHVIDHMVVHSTEYPHKCDKCEREFRYKRSLNRHLMWHAGTKGIPCIKPDCTQTFTSQVGLNRHLASHDTKKIPILYNCNICNQRFKSLSTMRKHYLFEHEHKSKADCKDVGVGTDDFDLKKKMEQSEEINESELVDSILVNNETVIDHKVQSDLAINRNEADENQVIVIVVQEGQKQIVIDNSTRSSTSTNTNVPSITSATQEQSQEYLDLQQRNDLLQTLIDYAEKHKSDEPISITENSSAAELVMHNYCVSNMTGPDQVVGEIVSQEVAIATSETVTETQCSQVEAFNLDGSEIIITENL